MLFNHFYACAAILGDLVYARTFHKAKADKGSKSTERYAHLYTNVMEQAAALTASKMEEITMGH